MGVSEGALSKWLVYLVRVDSAPPSRAVPECAHDHSKQKTTTTT